MANSKLLYDQKIQFSDGKFEARIIVYEVAKSRKFPEGVKLKCVLLDLEVKVPVLLLDNHEPFGYHIHTKMPYDKSHRVFIDIQNYTEAIEFFINEVSKVVNNEN